MPVQGEAATADPSPTREKAYGNSIPNPVQGAAEGGAFCRARGMSGQLSGGSGTWMFLGVFAACMGLHALWNSGLAGFHDMVGRLGVLAWLLVWHLLRKGYGQLETET